MRRDELGSEGQQLWDGIVNTWGDLAVTASGGLAGPFNALVTAPDAGRRLSALGATLRSAPTIERRLSEVAIITIGARWQAEYEWWAHAPMAREHGVAGAGSGRDRARRGPAVRSRTMNGPSTRSPASSVTPAAWTRRRTMPRTAFSATPGWWSWCRCAGTTH